MTHYERSPLPLVKGDQVKHFDDGLDGHPVKWVNGKVTGVSDEGFEVQWEDLPWPTDYRWDKVYLKGEQIIDENRLEFVFNVQDCYKCNPEKATNTIAPTTEGIYKCKCGNEYDIPTGKYL